MWNTIIVFVVLVFKIAVNLWIYTQSWQMRHNNKYQVLDENKIWFLKLLK